MVVDGDSVARANRRTLARIRRKVGYVFQNAALFDSMSVFENVAQGLSDEEQRELGDRRLMAEVAARWST